MDVQCECSFPYIYLLPNYYSVQCSKPVIDEAALAAKAKAQKLEAADAKAAEKAARVAQKARVEAAAAAMKKE
jgi:hypothetical protein